MLDNADGETMSAISAEQPDMTFVVAPERRLARNRWPYTRIEFLQWYGDAGEHEWADAGILPISAPPRLGDGRPDGVNSETMSAISAAQPDMTTRAAAQLPAGSADGLAVPAPLMPEHVIAIQQEEAARGPPRSLHRLARDALNAISRRPTRSTVNLDDCFPWVQYVAAHRLSAQIIGSGITHAHAVFFQDTNDANRGGAPRLDFCFYRTDGSICRVHPGNKPKRDADLLFRQ